MVDGQHLEDGARIGMTTVDATVFPPDMPPHTVDGRLHQRHATQAHGEGKLFDSSETLLDMYLKKAEEEDNETAERWQRDAEGIRLFVCFSLWFSYPGSSLCRLDFFPSPSRY
jgi:hypothetical protein